MRRIRKCVRVWVGVGIRAGRCVALLEGQSKTNTHVIRWAQEEPVLLF